MACFRFSKIIIIMLVISLSDFLLLPILHPPILASKIESDTILIASDFEDQTRQGWTRRIGGEAVTVADTEAHSGSYSLFTTNRQQAYAGPSLNVIDQIQMSRKYKVTLWVKLAPEESPAKLRVSLQRSYKSTAPSYDTLIGDTDVTADDWVKLSGEYQLREEADQLSLYVESASGLASFYMDDFTLERIPVLPIQENIPSLKDVLSKDFPSGIGVALEQGDIEGIHADIVKKHFDSVVLGNAMKPAYIQPQENNFTFGEADKVVQFARENHMSVRGHTLVWHQQSPAWLFLDSDGKPMVDENDSVKQEANKKLLLKRLEKHIRTVVEHFGTEIYAYDVVNEVISDSGGLRDSEWYKITGTDYIKMAFIWARQYAPARTKLYINDYNTHAPVKRQALYELVKQLRDEGVPIDGIGHQTHISLYYPSLSQISDSIKLFGELGLDNQITELDISLYRNETDKYETIEDELLIQQGERYRDLFAEFSKLNPYISSVVFWGIGDDNTWLKTFPTTRLDLPLLFDEQLQAKPAFWGVVDPAQMGVEDPVQILAIKEPSQETAAMAKPVAIAIILAIIIVIIVALSVLLRHRR